jgi:hypothetical protein
MRAIAEELDRRLAQLDAPVAQQLERLVRDALALVDGSASRAASGAWPEGYFARTAGALAGEEFERPQQGLPPIREAW